MKENKLQKNKIKVNDEKKVKEANMKIAGTDKYCKALLQ